MGYKIGNDNGRVEGSFDTLTTEKIVGKFEYGEKDTAGSNEIIREVKSEEGDVYGNN